MIYSILHTGIDLIRGYLFVFGALISPTDPIAALAILKKVGLPKPLETIVNGESLFNDGVGIGIGLVVSLVMHHMLLRTWDYGINNLRAVFSSKPALIVAIPKFFSVCTNLNNLLTFC